MGKDQEGVRVVAKTTEAGEGRNFCSSERHGTYTPRWDAPLTLKQYPPNTFLCRLIWGLVSC